MSILTCLGRLEQLSTLYRLGCNQFKYIHASAAQYKGGSRNSVGPRRNLRSPIRSSPPNASRRRLESFDRRKPRTSGRRIITAPFRREENLNPYTKLSTRAVDRPKSKFTPSRSRQLQLPGPRDLDAKSSRLRDSHEDRTPEYFASHPERSSWWPGASRGSRRVSEQPEESETVKEAAPSPESRGERFRRKVGFLAYSERVESRSVASRPSHPKAEDVFIAPPNPPLSSPRDLPKYFQSPPLSPALLDGVSELLGKARPTSIQALSLKYMFSDQATASDKHPWKEHVLAAETGSGKTMAYLLPFLHHLKRTESTVTKSTNSSRQRAAPSTRPRGLILAPTHELARQLAKAAKSLVHGEGAKLRVLCASRRNDTGSTSSSSVRKMEVRAREMSQLRLADSEEGEFTVERKETSEVGLVRQAVHEVDIVVATPMHALEMVKGRGWDKDIDDGPEERLAAWERDPNSEDEKERQWRRKMRKNFIPEMGLDRIEWVVVDEADVLFDTDFREYIELLLSDIALARGVEIARSKDPTQQASVSYPFHLTLASATIPLSLSSYLNASHPRMTYLTSPNLHRLPKQIKMEYVNWTSGNHNKDVESKLREVWAGEEWQAEDGNEWGGTSGQVQGEQTEGSKVLIFANRNTKVEELGDWLEEKGIRNVAMTSRSKERGHGNNRHIAGFLNSPLPTRAARGTSGQDQTVIANPATLSTAVVLAQRRDHAPPTPQQPNVLITTSLLSRGLDFSSQISHVFILDSPRNMIDFLHRAGRTARAGRSGRVVLFGKGDGRGSDEWRRMRKMVRTLT